MQSAINKAITTSLTKPMSEAMAAEFELDQDEVLTFVTAFLSKQLNAKKGKTPSDPNKPKKTNGWMLFSKANRDNVKAELAEEQESVKMTDVSKRLGEMWKDLSDDDKKTYNDQAVAENEESGATPAAAKPAAKKGKKPTPPKKAGKAKKPSDELSVETVEAWFGGEKKLPELRKMAKNDLGLTDVTFKTSKADLKKMMLGMCPDYDEDEDEDE